MSCMEDEWIGVTAFSRQVSYTVIGVCHDLFINRNIGIAYNNIIVRTNLQICVAAIESCKNNFFPSELWPVVDR